MAEDREPMPQSASRGALGERLPFRTLRSVRFSPGATERYRARHEWMGDLDRPPHLDRRDTHHGLECAFNYGRPERLAALDFANHPGNLRVPDAEITGLPLGPRRRYAVRSFDNLTFRMRAGRTKPIGSSSSLS
jgi:hypothetical protein